MQSQIENFMKPGIVHFMIYPVLLGYGPILESLKKIIEDDYFKLIELTWFKDPEVRLKAKKMLNTSGIEMKYGAPPRLLSQKLNLNSEDESHRLKAVQEIKDAIDDASDFGISDVGILSGAYPGVNKKVIAMDLLEKSLLEICSYASKKSINIVMEVFDQAIDKKCLIGKAEDAREIASRICAVYSNFGLMVDLSHIPLLDESPSQALQPVKEFVRHIHIGNCYMDLESDQAYGDNHPRFGYPGGANDVEQIVEFLEELFKIGYLKRDGMTPMPISFEIKPVGDEDPELVIANAKRKLAEAWRKLVI
jgi:sugar phosphate isomerase/epimerase